ncbi:MAG: 3-dehydroquinate synthase [Gammaproteobacteria bacterium TMED112]|nr:MAG: 3-dehydroquinate synthase [Gammaproteobacteria bacterium TMED112]|tara:strand:+ start:7318 stop:8391 length:1074 start_codon:yes stop_codon:yes gene_type:complete
MKNLVFNSEEHSVKISFVNRTKKICELIQEDRKYCVILDKKISSLHAAFHEELKSKDFLIFLIDEPEKQKNIHTCLEVINLMQKEGLNRNDAVIGIGGGAITDLAGFVASSYMRGITYFQIPTSLLAQVDASIGGKTGINYGNIKNFIGSFYNPSEIIICAEFLQSLNQQDFLNGFSEVLKHCIITSKESLDKLKNLAGEIQNRESNILLGLIEQSIDIKAQVVTKDFKEKGERKFLNFGHTFAHGIESINHDAPILHGHAVLIGMLMALDYSKELGFLSRNSCQEIKDIICSFSYDFSNIKLDAKGIFEAMKSDKKNTKAINLILLKEVGQPLLFEETSNDNLQKFITKFIDDFKK